MVKRTRTHTKQVSGKDESGRGVVALEKVSEIINKKCPRCAHSRAWAPRGEIATVYLWKCTRCGYQEPVNKRRA